MRRMSFRTSAAIDLSSSILLSSIYITQNRAQPRRKILAYRQTGLAQNGIIAASAEAYGALAYSFNIITHTKPGNLRIIRAAGERNSRKEAER